MIEYVSPEGLRVDGRRPKELRALSADMGVLATADGSATFQMGNTKARSQKPTPAALRSATMLHGTGIIMADCASIPFSLRKEAPQQSPANHHDGHPDGHFVCLCAATSGHGCSLWASRDGAAVPGAARPSCNQVRVRYGAFLYRWGRPTNAAAISLNCARQSRNSNISFTSVSVIAT